MSRVAARHEPRVAACHEPRSGPPDKPRSQSEPRSQSGTFATSYILFTSWHSVSYKTHLISSHRQVSSLTA
eukprot:scaffold13562_cov63-Phaeocystis_antarctica.AAC.12